MQGPSSEQQHVCGVGKCSPSLVCYQHTAEAAITTEMQGVDTISTVIAAHQGRITIMRPGFRLASYLIAQDVISFVLLAHMPGASEPSRVETSQQ